MRIIGGASPVGQVEREAKSAKRRWQKPDALVLGVYVLAAAYVSFPLWTEPGLKVSPLFQDDHVLFEWFLAHAVRTVTHLENPLFTHLINAPDGVNMIANASALGLTLPLVPVTALFGPHVSVLVIHTVSPLAIAAAWYFVLSRHVVRSTFAAAVGGWFCGFAPNVIAHTGGHPHLTFQFLLPFIALFVLRLREPGRAWRNGAILGLLVAYQAFISEEILLLTALACGVFVVAYAAQRPRDVTQMWRPMLASMSVTTIVASALLAYPLWLQFFGPGNYRGLHPAHQAIKIELASVTAFATESIAVSANWVSRTVLRVPTEENALFGWSVLLLAGAAFLLARGPVARALKVTALAFFVLGLGGEISYRGDPTGFPGPWGFLEELPLFDSVLPSRFGFVVTAAVGILLALATQTVWDFAERRTQPGRIRGVWLVALALALVPAAPTPLTVERVQPVPRFFTDGSWRAYVDEGETLVPLPFPTPATAIGMRWAAASDLGFAIPGGFFVAPLDGIEGRAGTYGAPLSRTAKILDQVESSGVVQPSISDDNRRAAIEDLRLWRASVVVLPIAEKNAEALRSTVEALIGPAQRVEDVWLWDIPAVAMNTGEDA